MDDFFATAPSRPADGTAPGWPAAGHVAATHATPQGLPVPALGLGVGGLLLLIGSLLPWVSVFTMGFSGLDLRYGLVTLVAGLLALLAAAESATGRVVGSSRAAGLHVAALGGAVAGLVTGLWVWARLREVLAATDGLVGESVAFADVAASGPAGVPTDPFAGLGQELLEILMIRAGAGLWLVLAAAAITAVSAAAALRSPRR